MQKTETQRLQDTYEVFEKTRVWLKLKKNIYIWLKKYILINMVLVEIILKLMFLLIIKISNVVLCLQLGGINNVVRNHI